MTADSEFESGRSLISGFLNSFDQYSDRPALEVDSSCFTYSDLKSKASSLAATLQVRQPDAASKLTCVLAHRSITAFTGILGALLRGHGYVPLNPAFPSKRTLTMIERSNCTSIIVGIEAIPALEGILPALSAAPMLFVIPELDDIEKLRADFPQHTFVGRSGLELSDAWIPPVVNSSDVAYLLFTSGSTGQPKGVAVTNGNIRHFIDVVVERYEITELDRLSQMFELVFDLSLFDLFVAWDCGACVCCPSDGDAQLPARYLKESRITVWFSVPSLAGLMKRMRMLQAGLYEDLRISLFCGEALLSDIAETWSSAAPNSVVENLYGPTEVTLACTAYRWSSEQGLRESEHGIVPIGTPFPGMTAIVVDQSLREVGPDRSGELLMSGPQVAPGYWRNSQKSSEAFVIPPGNDRVFYRTGDLVKRPRNGEPIIYIGRVDQQIKIRGHRVELGEIEAFLREAAEVESAVAIGWPMTQAGADGVVAFLQGVPASYDQDTVLEELESRLPAYMVPTELQIIDEMPLNANGKIDRTALLETLENEQSRPGIGCA